MSFLKSVLKVLFASLLSFVVLFTLTACKNDNEQEDTKRVVNGEVVCGDEKISGATVRIRNTDYSATTNANGEFSFEITESVEELGEFRIMVSAEGYESATYDVTSASFVNGVATIRIDLVSSEVTLSGVVKDKNDQALSGVNVVIANTDYETTTNANGEYSFNIDRLISATLEFSKDYYKTKTVTITDLSTGTSFINDVQLEDNIVTISGKVENYYTGPVAGATVRIEGTDYVATSGADGSYTISNALVANEQFNLEVSKDGYLDGKYAYSDNNDLELVQDYHQYASLNLYSGNSLNGYVTKSSEGLYFKYLLDQFRYQSGVGEEKVQVYINPGQYTDPTRLVSTSNPDGGHAIEIALTSNNGIVVFVNYYKGVNFITNILWGNEVAYTVGEEDGKVALKLFIKYSVFGDYCGADFAIDADSIIGLGLNFHSDIDQQHLYNWETPDMLGVDEDPVVAHDNPKDWVRLARDGQSVYEGSSNTRYEDEERTITGRVGYEEEVTQQDLDLSTWAVLKDEVSGELGTLDATWSLSGKILTMTYTGKSSDVADTDEFWNFLTVDNFTNKIDIRFKNGWTGVYNWTTGVWMAWSAEKIGSATYTRDTEADTLTITMIIDLSYFEDAGMTISTIKVCPIIFGKANLTYRRFVPQAGVVVAVPQFNYNHYETITQQDLQLDTWAVLKDEVSGELGTLDATWSLNGKILTMTYTGKSSDVADTDEFWNFLTVDNFTNKIDIRFKNGWTGVYNWTTGVWMAWSAEKIGSATYTRDTEADTLTITMIIDLSYFEDAGMTISTIKVCPIIFGKANLTYTRQITRELANWEKEFYVMDVTDEEGYYTLVIPADKINVDNIRVVFSSEDCIDVVKVFARSDFEDNTATFDTSLEEGKLSVSVGGYVKDAEGNPIEGATVTISGTTISTTTDAEGKYEFVEVDHDVAPFKLSVSKNGYYVVVRQIEELVTTDSVDFELVLKPNEAAASTFEITNEFKQLGVLTPDNVKVTIKLDANGYFVIGYEFAEGAVTSVPEELLKVFFNFKDSNVIYSVRVTNKLWTGIYNENDKKWEGWNAKVGNPEIQTAEGVTKIYQTIDLSFFSDLSQDISIVKISVSEYTNNNDYALSVGENLVLSTTDASKFVTLVMPE